MKIIHQIVKLLLAGITAVIIVSLILLAYSHTPVHFENKNKNTDYVWEANAHWAKMTEGISFGRFDANGYNNKTVIENPDIIILGSSHMEATNVMQDENIGYLLNEKFDGKYSVYNMGISGHHFFKVCQYLSNNLAMYDHPPKVAILETSTVMITEENVDDVINHNVDFTVSYNNKIMVCLQKIPFFRQMYNQCTYGLLELFMSPKEAGVDSTAFIGDTDIQSDKEVPVTQSAYDELFTYLSDLEEQYGTQIIIFYHPAEVINKDGTIKFDSDRAALMAFSTTSTDKGITFVDMTDSFEEMYYNSYHLPHGFATGELATGHLNRYGHSAIANELYQTILDMENSGKL